MIARFPTVLIASTLLETRRNTSSERTVFARPDEGTFPVG